MIVKCWVCGKEIKQGLLQPFVYDGGRAAACELHATHKFKFVGYSDKGNPMFEEKPK